MKTVLIVAGLTALVGIVASCQSEQAIEFDRYYSSGAALYQTHCQNCHGENGQGLAALIPPLTDSKFLMENLHQLPCYVQNGLNGKIKVDQRDFEGQMPKTELSPIEIAEVLTYVTNSFGNKNGLMSSDAVAKDLKACK